jgi:hypothetical protein
MLRFGLESPLGLFRSLRTIKVNCVQEPMPRGLCRLPIYMTVRIWLPPVPLPNQPLFHAVIESKLIFVQLCKQLGIASVRAIRQRSGSAFVRVGGRTRLVFHRTSRFGSTRCASSHASTSVFR